MRCAWKELLGILPVWLRPEVDRLGKETAQEIRLRVGSPAELVLRDGKRWLERAVTREDLVQCIHNASRYSPWTAESTARGYLTAPGGHRIGLCGEVIVKDGIMAGIRSPTSVCIRIARDFPSMDMALGHITDPALIIGAPGWGKTTLLRCAIRQISERGEHVAVVDERDEIFPLGGHFPAGRCTDVMSGCSKVQGLETVLRTMSPDWIAVDEITEEADCNALIRAANCGVHLLATAHAGSLVEFTERPVYRPLLTKKIFRNLLVLRKDKTWKWERMIT